MYFWPPNRKAPQSSSERLYLCQNDILQKVRKNPAGFCYNLKGPDLKSLLLIQSIDHHLKCLDVCFDGNLSERSASLFLASSCIKLFHNIILLLLPHNRELGCQSRLFIPSLTLLWRWWPRCFLSQKTIILNFLPFWVNKNMLLGDYMPR